MFEEKTPEYLKEQILTNLADSGSDLSTEEGDFADTMAGPLAVELFKFYGAFNTVKPIVWVEETSGPYLDLAAETLGIVPRKAGSAARVALTLTGQPGYKIEKGTVFMADTDEDLFYDLETETVIPISGEITAFATAREFGTKYNLPANMVTRQFSNNAGIERVTNQDPAEGGTDEESDKSLYLRIVFARQRPSTSGNKYDYERWALEVPGVGFAVVLPLWDGNGTVKVIVADENRQPVDSEVVENCYKHIERVRPIGATVTVVSATAKAIDIAAKLELEENLDKTLDESTYIDSVQQKVKEELKKHFAEMALRSSKVIYNWVGAVVIGTENVKDYKNLTLNGSNEDIILEQGEVPLVGEVVLT